MHLPRQLLIRPLYSKKFLVLLAVKLDGAEASSIIELEHSFKDFAQVDYFLRS
jgi:hypothetical protein